MTEHTVGAGADADSLLRDGIAAAKAGERERARELLMQVVELDEGQASAWLWLSGVVDGLEDREVCLENVLTLDPDNAAARKGLDWVRAQRQKQASWSPVEGESTVALEQAPAVPQVPSNPPAAPRRLWDDPPDPYLCPYCAAQTREEDHQCPACENELWLRVRRRDAHSLWLWNLMVVRISMVILFALMPVIALTVVAFIVADEYDPLLLAPTYLGQESDLAPELASRALGILPRAYLLPFLALSLYSIALLVGMYLRWKPVFYILLGGVAVRFAVAVTAMVLGSYYGLVCGGFGIVLSIGAFVILLSVEDDFSWDTERVRFVLDRKSTGGVSRLTTARVFSERGMWALAALYLRAAVAKMPGQVAGHARLARAYLKLGRPDLARESLQDARQIDPNDPVVAELVAMIDGAPAP
jgi:tetratricopeptide (TPR) repeat protein